MDETNRKGTSSETRPEYEPPEVERVLDRDELGREALYAGAPVSDRVD